LDEAAAARARHTPSALILRASQGMIQRKTKWQANRNCEQLGAKVLMAPLDVPNVGRFCMIQDPQGAVISVIIYKNA